MSGLLLLLACCSPAPPRCSGSGCVMIDGKMQDDATYKQCNVMVNAARLIARRDPDYAARCGFSAAELAAG